MFTFWNYYVLKVLRLETITCSDSTLSDINVVLCYILSQYLFFSGMAWYCCQVAEKVRLIAQIHNPTPPPPAPGEQSGLFEHCKHCKTPLPVKDGSYGGATSKRRSVRDFSFQGRIDIAHLPDRLLWNIAKPYQYLCFPYHWIVELTHHSFSIFLTPCSTLERKLPFLLRIFDRVHAGRALVSLQMSRPKQR